MEYTAYLDVYITEKLGLLYSSLILLFLYITS